jgi:hypothetical protein
MGFKMSKNEKIYHALDNAIKSAKTSIEWEELSAAVKDANIKITNWMLVRGILQGMFINTGTRSDDLYKEEYLIK